MGYTADNPEVIYETIDGETIVIHLGTGTYYSLRETGAEVWAAIVEGKTRPEIVAQLEQRYDAGRATIDGAVGELLRELAEEGLVRGSQNDPVSAVADEVATGVVTRLPYVVPRLEKYTDMQDIILLDPVHTVDERGWPNVAEAAGG